MVRFSRTLPVAVALLGAAAALPAQAGVITVGDMVPNEWQTSLLRSNAISTVTNTVQPHPGQPGDSEWRLVQSAPRTNAPFVVSDLVVNMYLGALWSPVVDGAVDEMQIQFDARGVTSTFANNVSGFFRAVIEQGGAFYAQRSAFATVLANGIDTTLSWTLDETTVWSSFIGGAVGTAAPDFSAGGGPIRFGYQFSSNLSCNGPQGCLASLGDTALDNLRVRVSAVPAAAVSEPGALLLVAIGLLAARRRRAQPSVITVSTPV